MNNSNKESIRAQRAEKYLLSLLTPDTLLDKLANDTLDITGTTAVTITLFGKHGSTVIASAGQNLVAAIKLVFCDMALYRRTYIEVEDTLEDPLFKHDPLALSNIGIRFFASNPITDSGGFVIGSFCALNRTPMRFTPEQRSRIEEMSVKVMQYLELNSLQ